MVIFGFKLARKLGDGVYFSFMRRTYRTGKTYPAGFSWITLEDAELALQILRKREDLFRYLYGYPADELVILKITAEGIIRSYTENFSGVGPIPAWILSNFTILGEM